jgi:hypothetical protein
MTFTCLDCNRRMLDTDESDITDVCHPCFEARAARRLQDLRADVREAVAASAVRKGIKRPKSR